MLLESCSVRKVSGTMEIFRMDGLTYVLCKAKGQMEDINLKLRTSLPKRGCLEILVGNYKDPEFQAPNAATPL